MPDLATLTDLVTRGGTIAVLLLILVGLVKGWWLTQRHHQEVCEGLQRELALVTSAAEEWRELALRGMALTESVTGKERRGR